MLFAIFVVIEYKTTPFYNTTEGFKLEVPI